MGNCSGKGKAKALIDEPPMPSELSLAKKAELKRVLDADGIKREEGDPWFVVEAAWVQRWLAFVQGDDSAKKPGPIRNGSLLFFNKDAKVWMPKPLLRAARREHMGHYRRVNQHVWSLWTGTYLGSGPALWVETPPFEDASNWILDPSYEGSGARQGGGVGGNAQGNGGGEESRGADGEQAEVNPDRVWPSSTLNLAIGEMEDEGIGNETTAQAAAFFDVALESPRMSQGASAVKETASRAGSNRTAQAGSGSAQKAGAGGRPLSLLKDARVKTDPEPRRPSAAEQWMYGGAGPGLME